VSRPLRSSLRLPDICRSADRGRGEPAGRL